MAKTAILAIRIISDATKAAKGLQGTGKELSTFERNAAKANKAALGIVGGLTTVGVAAFQQANELQQAQGAVEAVFGSQAKVIERYAKRAAGAFGLSRAEYSQTASVFGAQLKNMGVAADQLVPTTDKLIGLGSDLAATFGGSTSDAVAAIGSLMRGEADPIERYGVGIKQADVNARLAAQGQDKLTGSAKKTAETEARLALLMEQTTAAQGQRSRESDTAASRQEVAMARMKNAGAALGKILLPIVASVAANLAGMAGYVEKNATTFQILAGVLATVAGAILAINLAVKAWRATVAAAAAIQGVWNAALAGNPLGLIVIAVLAVAAGFVLLYKRSETFRTIVQAVMKAASTAISWVVSKSVDLYRWVAAKLPGALNAAKTVAVTAFRAWTAPIRTVVSLATSVYNWTRTKIPAGAEAMKEKAVSAWKAITAPIEAVVGWIQSLIDKLRNIKWPSPPKWLTSAGKGLGKILGGSSVSVSAASTPRVLAAAGGGTTIVIQGALDPVAVGDQVATMLRRRSTRNGVRL